MARALTITVHPAAVGAEYLSVSDAMRQILDVVEALERSEAPESADRTIVWRLTEARTNSPPLTITAQPYSVDPSVSIALTAARVLDSFSETVSALLDGRSPIWAEAAELVPLKRLLTRNLQGVGRTTISTGPKPPIEVIPDKAQRALATIAHVAVIEMAAAPDESRTEYGSIEAEIVSITRWYGKPALKVIERLSRAEATCVLNEEIAKEIGPEHRWHEAWEGQRLLITGALHYGGDGLLKRVDAIEVEDRAWTDIAVADLNGIDLLEGRSVRDHLDLVRGEQ